MDGEAAGGTSGKYSQGRNVGAGGGPETWDPEGDERADVAEDRPLEPLVELVEVLVGHDDSVGTVE
ncbi:MAG TPA: hypothetical protein VK548_01850 [Candidatus Acidoferrum sp.]|nr:hypothetical protein [Candidatus Acidoferrum sp.]